MPNSTLRSRNSDRVADAHARGQRLQVGVALRYRAGSSDKFWNATWARRSILVHYGRRTHTWGPGQHVTHHFDTEAQAASKMWSLLRDKTSKGYAVVDATFLYPATGQDADSASAAHRNFEHLLTEANLTRTHPLPDTAATARSPRTAKVGGGVLLDITGPSPSDDNLANAVAAHESERFLIPLVLSHPNLPEVARFMASMSGHAAFA